MLFTSELFYRPLAWIISGSHSVCKAQPSIGRVTGAQCHFLAGCTAGLNLTLPASTSWALFLSCPLYCIFTISNAVPSPRPPPPGNLDSPDSSAALGVTYSYSLLTASCLAISVTIYLCQVAYACQLPSVIPPRTSTNQPSPAQAGT